ncbi:MAG: glycosyltransferase, partial [Candidatus Altiarchaeota archaeon]|nr:glycosyltransferase [Candidatus Altiarchaeota archaeon]
MTEVSACIIAYEENDDLRRCLESIKGYVDEIILVNTGPFDFTEFCPEYTSKIFNDPWRDDFARARNLSLEKAKGGWILFIDSDEYLSSNGLLQELSGLDGDAFIIEQHNLREDGSIIINDKQIRVFRNIGF